MKLRSLPVALWRVFILAAVGAYLLIPLIAMADFSTKIGPTMRGLRAWKAIADYPELTQAVIWSLQLAVAVMALVIFVVVPTIVWVQLRLPKLRRVIELICVLPLALPAIVLVVGLSPIYRWISINISESSLTLSFVYLILVLPYVYRSVASSLANVDIHTLHEAARTLGAPTLRSMFTVVMPTIRAGVMSGAVIAIALVLGEYTIASLLNFQTLQVALFLLGKADATVSVAVALASLVFVLILLIILPTSTVKRTVVEEEVSLKGEIR